MNKLLSLLALTIVSLPVSSQNVGIGTTTPNRAKLEINGGVGRTVGIFGGEVPGISLQKDFPAIGFNQYFDGSNSRYIGNGYAAVTWFNPALGTLNLDMFPHGSVNNSGTSIRAFTVANNGNIGLLGANTNSALQFPNTINNRKITLWESANNAHQYYGFGMQSGQLTYNVGGPNDQHLFYAGNGPATSTRLMSIGGNKKVAIGKYNDTGKLGINHEDPGFTLTLMQADHTGLLIVDANTYNSWELKTEMVAGPNYLFFLYRDNFGNRRGGAFIDHNGNFHNGSDYRVKKNIQPLPDVLPALLQLQPKTYNMKSSLDDKKNIGFIAQDLKKSFPDLVSVVDGTTAGYKDIQDLHTINYSGLSVLAIKAIQEQQIMMEAQQKQIKELIEEIQLLKEKLR